MGVEKVAILTRQWQKLLLMATVCIRALTNVTIIKITIITKGEEKKKKQQQHFLSAEE